MKHYKISEVAEMLGVTVQTVRNYTKQGRLSFSRTPGGNRIFTEKDINDFMGIPDEEKTVFYIRSSSGNKQTMDNQKNILLEKYGQPVYIYSDKASGLNENRPGLAKMIKDAKNNKFNKIIITNKDRLSRFGYSYLKLLFEEYNVEILVSEELKDKSMYDELIQDFMSLIASFSGKYYKIRSKENQKRILSLINNELDKTK